ncbi:RNA polymerase sigma factor [Patescibacteria group bacterium]|nr:RNA polymerase sigma factor [Patescibacteria group bacterium]
MIDFKGKSDKELVKLSLLDSDNFLFLMEKYKEPLKRYIWRISAVTKEEAEDILQEVFIKVYRNLYDYDGEFSFSSWIYRITHNETISCIRKMKVRPQLISVEDDEVGAFVQMLPGDADVENEVKLKELSKIVRRMLANLSEKYRTVLILRYLEDKSYEEISDILQKSIGTVSTLINRAKKQFKDMAIVNKSLL